MPNAWESAPLLDAPPAKKKSAWESAPLTDAPVVQEPVGGVGRASPTVGAAAVASPLAPAAPSKPEAKGVGEIVKEWLPTTWPARMAKDIYGAVTLPGDVVTGKADISTPEAQKRAFDLALTALPGASVPKGVGAKAAKPMTVEGAVSEAPPLAKEVLDAPKELRTKVADDLFRLRQSGVADRIDISKKAETVPPAARTPEMQEKFFKFGEGDPSVQLTPEEQQVFDTTIQPMRQERAQLYSDLKGLGYPVEDANHMHRMVKGKTRVYDDLEGGAAANPVGGSRRLPTSAPSLKERKYFAIETPDGARKVVHIDGDKMTVMENKKGVPISHTMSPMTPVDDLKPGARINAGGRDWEIKQAHTSEIEQHTDTEYYKNAFASEAKALADLRAAKRNADYFEELKASPDFLEHAMRDGGNQPVPAGWRKVDHPQLEGWYVSPKLADAIEDFLGPRLSNWEEGLASANRFMAGSIFWNPLPHVENVATHWFSGRGWDNFTPQGMKRFGQTMPKAIKEVVTQGPMYQKMLKEGGGLVYGGVAQQNFYEQMMKKMGQQMERDPSKWDPIARIFGVNPGTEFVKWWYDKANRSLWAMGDMFMMQRYMENMAKGMSERAAIKEAERHIPNYRIPDEVLGSRGWSQFMQNPAMDIFSRYHYGMFRSYAEILKDFYKGSPKEKLDAAGNVFATAVLMGVLYPAVDMGLNALLGKDESGKERKAEKLRRGSASIPQMAIDYYGGNKDFPELVRNSMTLAPAPVAIWDLYENRDPFTGQHIMTSGGVVGAGQALEHGAQVGVAPYKLMTQVMKDAEEKGVPKSALDVIMKSVVGIRDPSERAAAAKLRAERYLKREDMKRARKPKGPIEGAFRSFGGPVE